MTLALQLQHFVGSIKLETYESLDTDEDDYKHCSTDSESNDCTCENLTR